ncbi:MAG: hypothetical protein M0T73_16005 [Deltaproteobacteria bacterium]|nr:hypothetical protein [Deltaproteobacteria bacterium]
MNEEISHKKKHPEDLKIQKPLSPYTREFDEVLDILLATKTKKHEPKKKLKEIDVSGEVNSDVLLMAKFSKRECCKHFLYNKI